MTKQSLIMFFVLILSVSVYGQIETPFYGFDANRDYSIIKRDTTGIYFFATRDSTKIVFISKNTTYKLFDRNYNLIAEGDLGGRIYVDYYKRFGKWTEYFSNREIKAMGYYYADQPIGLWQFYYPNGHLKETYSISLVETDSSSNFCMTGSYQEFYDNGQLKINGFYKSTVDTISVKILDPESGDNVLLIYRLPVSKKFGIWTYYKLNGELEKKDEFRD